MLKRKFKFPKGCSISELVLRETTGEDEEMAIQLAGNKVSSVAVLWELISLAAIEVDGAPVAAPFSGYKKWNSKTRSLAMKAYLALNGVEDQDTDDFLSKSESV